MKSIQYLIMSKNQPLCEAKTKKELIDKYIDNNWYILPLRQISMENGFPCYTMKNGKLIKIGRFDIKYSELSLRGIQSFTIHLTK